MLRVLVSSRFAPRGATAKRHASDSESYCEAFVRANCLAFSSRAFWSASICRASLMRSRSVLLQRAWISRNGWATATGAQFLTFSGSASVERWATDTLLPRTSAEYGLHDHA